MDNYNDDYGAEYQVSFKAIIEEFHLEVIHMPEMITDERFLTVPLRVKNNEIQKQYIESWTSQYTVDEIVDMALAKGVPAGPIYNIQQIVADEHIAQAREMFVEIDHPVIGRIKVNGNPIKMMETMPKITRPAPTLGQHNREVYQGMLGLDDAELQKLQEDGVI